MPSIYSWNSVFNPGRAKDFFALDRSKPFETDTAGFSHINAWWLSELSRLIYARGRDGTDTTIQSTIRNRYLSRVGLDEHWFYNGRYIQCALIRSSEDYEQPFSVLVFRGTRKGVSNWAFLLNLVLSPWPTGGRVHLGIKRAMLSAWTDIRSQLANVKTPLFYTGHSLGGALAVLAATLNKPAAVYTFGAPKMADNGFAEAVKELNCYRVVIPKDVVASVPPLPGYTHAGEAYCLHGCDNFTSSRCWLDAPTFLAAHSPSNYSMQTISHHDLEQHVMRETFGDSTT